MSEKWGCEKRETATRFFLCSSVFTARFSSFSAHLVISRFFSSPALTCLQVSRPHTLGAREGAGPWVKEWTRGRKHDYLNRSREVVTSRGEGRGKSDNEQVFGKFCFVSFVLKKMQFLVYREKNITFLFFQSRVRREYVIFSRRWLKGVKEETKREGLEIPWLKIKRATTFDQM